MSQNDKQMKTIYLFLALVVIAVFSACNKDAVRNRNVERVDFFTSNDDALKKTQKYVDGFKKDEIIEKILSISYIDSERKSYAFVFYRSNLGPGSVVIEQEYNGNAVLLSKSIKCEGEGCQCKVLSIIDDNGQVYLDCSCPSCSMIIR